MGSFSSDSSASTWDPFTQPLTGSTTSLIDTPNKLPELLAMGASIYAYFFLVLLAVAFARKAARKSRAPFPPGPKPLPLVGNLLQFPQQDPFLTFEKWQEEYGDVVYVNVLGNPTVILNSHKACIDLLDKRSAIYSDRPHLVMLVDLLKFGWDLVIMGYSARWRRHRRLFHQCFNENASKDYLGVQEQSTHNFLRRLAHKPEKFLEHSRLSFAEPVLRAVYGINVENYENEYVQVLEQTMTLASEAVIPGRFLVDLLPILKYVPSWFPGAGFQQYANLVKPFVKASKDLPAEYVMKRTAEGHPTATTIFSRMLEKCEQDESIKQGPDSAVDVAAGTAAIVYLVGSDTSLASIQVFFLLMANHPDVQRKAQAELDSVIGNGRLPTFNDMHDLPYIGAIVKEVLRWYPVVPTGVAHRLTQDDIYEGYLIPKGTTVIPNTWLILHNPEVYPNPFTFNPSRWLIDTPEGVKMNNAIPDPDAGFGFGRRICPGRYFGLNALFITISNVLACFNISPLDASGNPCESIPEAFTQGIISFPKPFQASIVPRSDKVLQLLKELEV